MCFGSQVIASNHSGERSVAIFAPSFPVRYAYQRVYRGLHRGQPATSYH